MELFSKKSLPGGVGTFLLCRPCFSLRQPRKQPKSFWGGVRGGLFFKKALPAKNLAYIYLFVNFPLIFKKAYARVIDL